MAQEFTHVATGGTDAIARENARFMGKVYLWMTIGVFLTALVCEYTAQTPEVLEFVLGNRGVFWGLVIAQLAAVFTLSFAFKRLSALACTGIFLGYAALTGLTLSTIFLVYARESITQVFGVTCFAFGGLSAFGYFTKKDLGPVGSFCTMGLFGLIGFGVISLFVPALAGGTASMVYSLCGLIIFSGLTAYDTQKIKAMNVIGNEGTAEDHKEAIFGALILYLDFINLFLQLLRLMGRRK
jgi:FtsH-binding integral membrane protein